MMMSDHREAVLRGAREAARAHEELGTQAGRGAGAGRIDVFEAIDRMGLTLMFRPLYGLLGIYLTGSAPGILINTQRPLSVRRFTAAHELGHHFMKHSASLDGDDVIGRAAYDSGTQRPTQEIEADAFASEFLLPTWFFKEQLQRYGWKRSDLKSPASIYQLSLRAGISYEAACHWLINRSLLDRQDGAKALAVAPKAIKAGLLCGVQPESWHPDVWVLCEADNGGFLQAAIGDYFSVSLLEHSGGGYTWETQGIANSDLELAADLRHQGSPEDVVGSHSRRLVIARAKSAGQGSVSLIERRPWASESRVLGSFGFAYDVSSPVLPGLFRAQLDRLLEGNR